MQCFRRLSASSWGESWRCLEHLSSNGSILAVKNAGEHIFLRVENGSLVVLSKDRPGISVLSSSVVCFDVFSLEDNTYCLFREESGGVSVTKLKRFYALPSGEHSWKSVSSSIPQSLNSAECTVWSRDKCIFWLTRKNNISVNIYCCAIDIKLSGEECEVLWDVSSILRTEIDDEDMSRLEIIRFVECMNGAIVLFNNKTSFFLSSTSVSDEYDMFATPVLEEHELAFLCVHPHTQEVVLVTDVGVVFFFAKGEWWPHKATASGNELTDVVFGIGGMVFVSMSVFVVLLPKRESMFFVDIVSGKVVAESSIPTESEPVLSVLWISSGFRAAAAWRSHMYEICPPSLSRSLKSCESPLQQRHVLLLHGKKDLAMITTLSSRQAKGMQPYPSLLPLRCGVMEGDISVQNPSLFYATAAAPFQMSVLRTHTRKWVKRAGKFFKGEKRMLENVRRFGTEAMEYYTPLNKKMLPLLRDAVEEERRIAVCAEVVDDVNTQKRHFEDIDGGIVLEMNWDDVSLSELEIRSHKHPHHVLSILEKKMNFYLSEGLEIDIKEVNIDDFPWESPLSLFSFPKEGVSFPEILENFKKKSSRLHEFIVLLSRIYYRVSPLCLPMFLAICVGDERVRDVSVCSWKESENSELVSLCKRVLIQLPPFRDSSMSLTCVSRALVLCWSGMYFEALHILGEHVWKSIVLPLLSKCVDQDDVSLQVLRESSVSADNVFTHLSELRTLIEEKKSSGDDMKCEMEKLMDIAKKVSDMRRSKS